MDWTLELIVVPVSDVDRAKDFYLAQCGFDLLVDHRAGDDFRVVQATPPGSACSIALMNDKRMAPGTLHGLHLVVPDIDAARAALAGRGVEVGETFHMAEAGQEPGPDPERRSYNSFCRSTSTLRERREARRPEKIRVRGRSRRTGPSRSSA